MTFLGRQDRSAAVALNRLLSDQAMRPVSDKRARLAILTVRLEQAGRSALTQHLARRVKTDPRFMAALQTLIRLPPPG